MADTNPDAARTGDAQPLGAALVAAGILTDGELRQALAAAKQWAVPLGQAVLALGFAHPIQLYSSLAAHLGLPFINVLHDPPAAELFDPAHLDFYLAAEAIPVGRSANRLVLATPDPLAAVRVIARRRAAGLATPAGEFSFAITPRLDVLWTLQTHFDAQFQHTARVALDEREPISSARSGLSTGQRGVCVGLAATLAVGLYGWPLATLAIVNVVLCAFFCAVLGLRAASILFGVNARTRRVPVGDVPNDADLPIYTLIIALYDEAEVLPLLAEALRALDYPRAKLDIKLVFEADDLKTVEAAKSLGLESYVEFIRVPPSSPRTKPKACNYALQFARGAFLVIYDAEDRPDPLQLKKAVAAFAQCDDRVACLQAPLTYFNAHENWLTRQFTIEFNMWFDLLLPTIERLRMPIPLGGTSSHFRIEALREAGAWDPFNVTEDADLGIRLAEKGYTCRILDSTTYEEANCQTGNWLRQRSRWLKGYAQTWLVHMRRPRQLYARLGATGFLGFQLLIGGSIISALVHPLVWIVALVGLTAGSPILAVETGSFATTALAAMNILLLSGGYVLSVAAGIAAVRLRGNHHLVPDTFFMVAYWPLISAGAYMALWQLATKPFYWEKTRHAISAASRNQLKRLANPTHTHTPPEP